MRGKRKYTKVGSQFSGTVTEYESVDYIYLARLGLFYLGAMAHTPDGGACARNHNLPGLPSSE